MIELLRFKRRAGERCPPDWMLTRHVSGESPDTSIESHLARCPRCAKECASLLDLVTQARRVPPPPELTEAARRTIATHLLTADRGTRPPRTRLAFLTLGFAAAGIVIVVAMLGAGRRDHAPSRAAVAAANQRVESSSHPPSRATIRAIGAARFTREQAPPDDVVRLEQGAIVVEVAPLQGGERFRVRTDDGEVEVRGTRFQATAADGKLMAVSVWHGRVEVRSSGGGLVVLQAGDEWVRGADDRQEARARPGQAIGGAWTSRPPAGDSAIDGRAVPRIVASASPTAALSRPRPPKPRPARAITEPAPSPRASAAPASFDRAWSLLRQGDVRRAADLFGEIERTTSDRDLAEDALYWCAVATTRTGERVQAQALFQRFLRRFPSSAHAGEAAAALGWLYLDTGQPAEARSAFERAGADPSPSVRASARDGLQRAPRP